MARGVKLAGIPLACLLFLSAALAAAGCGGEGDGGGEDGPPVVERPTAKRPIAAERRAFNVAIATRNCRAYQSQLLSLSRGRPPGAPVSADECKDPPPALEQLHGLAFLRSKAYGTGALMEATGRVTAYTVWVVDSDGRYRYAAVDGAGRHAQIGSKFELGPRAIDVANRFIDAIRDRDCDDMGPLFSRRASRIVVGRTPERGCRDVLNGQYLAPAVRATPEIQVEVMGGTRNFAFVGIPTRKAYFTLVLSNAARTPELLILDVVPSTPVAPPRG